MRVDNSRFRRNAWPTLGVELELQLIDAGTMALRGAVDEVRSGLPEELEDWVKPEFLTCYVELNTAVCRTVGELEIDLTRKLRGLVEAAGRSGVRLGWGGTHPFSRWQDQEVTADSRYYELSELLQETVLRPATFGLHVHVGLEDGDQAIGAMNRLIKHLPTLLAVSANSPFWCGRATGLHAHRIELLEGLPTSGLPPVLGGWDDYCELLERMAAWRFIRSEKDVWWDARPNAEHGTLEVRICDMPSDLRTVLALTALIQCLVHDLACRDDDAGPGDRHHGVLARQNRWRAVRYGLGAGLVDVDTGRTAPARQVVREWTDRLAGVADALDCRSYLEDARSLATRPTGAERQLTIFRQSGDLADVAWCSTLGDGSAQESWADQRAGWTRGGVPAPLHLVRL